MSDAADELTFLERHTQDLQRAKQLIAGGIAGCAAKTAVAPLSRVTILMQVQSMRPNKFTDGRTPNNQSLAASLRKIAQEEGPRGFWRGNGATMVHRFPYTAVTFYTNAHLRAQLQRSSALPEQARLLLAGAGSASLAVVTCYPLDVVKTRLVAQTGRQYYSGIVDAVRKIVRDESVLGLYRGLGTTLVCVVPSLALNFTLYEDFFALYAGLGAPPCLHQLLAGGSSGAAASALTFPVDLLRRQMQLVGLGGRPPVYASTFQAVQHIYKTGYSAVDHQQQQRLIQWYLDLTGRIGKRHIGAALGVREFFRGLVPELLKVTPHSAIMFCAHRQLVSQEWPCERRLLPAR